MASKVSEKIVANALSGNPLEVKKQLTQELYRKAYEKVQEDKPRIAAKTFKNLRGN